MPTYVHYICMCCSWRSDLQKLSNRCPWAIIRVLETEPRSLSRAARALTHQAFSPVCLGFLEYRCFSFALSLGWLPIPLKNSTLKSSAHSALPTLASAGFPPPGEQALLSPGRRFHISTVRWKDQLFDPKQSAETWGLSLSSSSRDFSAWHLHLPREAASSSLGPLHRLLFPFPFWLFLSLCSLFPLPHVPVYPPESPCAPWLTSQDWSSF